RTTERPGRARAGSGRAGRRWWPRAPHSGRRARRSRPRFLRRRRSSAAACPARRRKSRPRSRGGRTRERAAYNVHVIALLAGLALVLSASGALAQPADSYITEVVTVPSGELKLRAVLGRPRGDGPFPASIQNHGSMTVEEASRSPRSHIRRDP